jgi:AcrR family transcriptional regulator
MKKTDPGSEPAAPGENLAESTSGGLTDKQELAIELQVTGMKVQDVAKEVGISREQYWRWRTQDPTFTAALERRRAELHQGLVDRYWGNLVRKALDVAEDSLDEGDPEMARDVLRLASRGLTDVKTIPNEGPPSL